MIRDHNAVATNATCGGSHVSGGTDRSGSNQCQVFFLGGLREILCVGAWVQCEKILDHLFGVLFLCFVPLAWKLAARKRKQKSAKPTGLS